MFDSDLDRDGKSGRRAFLLTSASALAGAFLWSLRKPGVLAAAPAARGVPGEVTIVEFSDDGKRLKKERVAKVVKTEAEWQQQLSPASFTITRHADTEMAFSGQYWNLHDKGLYRCICCDNALFKSDTRSEEHTS